MSSIQSPGPKEVDTFQPMAHAPMGGLRDRRDWLIDKFRDHKARVATVTNIATGNWYTEWPDLSQTPEAPTMANMVELGIDHWSAIGGAVLPSIRVPLNKAADQRKEKTAARKRERRIRGLLEDSNASEIMAQLWADYAGTGGAICGVWANFGEDDPAMRNPYIMRYDPRHTYLIKDNLGNVTELLVARKISGLELRAMYPEWANSVFAKAKDQDVEEWFWYFKDRVVYALVDVSPEGRKVNRNVLVVDEEWDLGFVPAWEAVRPTFDGERRGVFDQAIHILRTMQRLMLMTIMSTEEHAFPAIAAYDAINAQDFGPAAVIQLRSSEGRIERLGPSSHFDVKDLIARLGEEVSKEGVYPQQLSGDPGASIVSARGINASMGALDARLALAHKQFEVMYGKVSGFLLAFDQTFCDGDKVIVGDERDNKDAEDYRPSKDIDGHFRCTATYGIGAGSDPANIEVRLSMHLSNALISRRTAREQIPFMEDPDGEEVRILRETFQDALVGGVLTMSQEGGDPTLAAKALKLMKNDSVSVEEILDEIVEAVLAPPEESVQAGTDPALEQIQGAESLARGGIPGNAEQALPPLAGILGQDARMVS
jgi:hypothetical protein